MADGRWQMAESLTVCLLCLLAMPGLASTRTFYFAATAVGADGLESDYSAEVSWERETGGPRSVTLAWNSCGTDTVKIYWGLAPGDYRHTNEVGAVCEATIELIPAPLTNCVVSVSATGPDMEWSFWPDGPWAWLGANAWAATNPPAPMLLFRGQGVTISRRSF
jgi:hypothetical protein